LPPTSAISVFKRPWAQCQWLLQSEFQCVLLNSLIASPWPGFTWRRDSVLVKQGWATQQQGETDRVNYAAQQQAKQVNDVAIQAQRPNCWYCATQHGLYPRSGTNKLIFSASC
jgi:hypothetical protein